jgi:hypothetical protein
MDNTIKQLEDMKKGRDYAIEALQILKINEAITPISKLHDELPDEGPSTQPWGACVIPYGVHDMHKIELLEDVLTQNLVDLDDLIVEDLEVIILDEDDGDKGDGFVGDNKGDEVVGDKTDDEDGDGRDDNSDGD